MLFRAVHASLACCTLVLSSVAGSLAQAPSNVAPKPQRVSIVGTLRVERYGSGSPAMIFIPGLGAGSWLWNDAVKTYAKNHAVYLVTLAGFDGFAAPPPGGNPLDLADASLLTLIDREQLDRPVIIGHTLGGFLAIRFGEEHSALVRGIVSVDYGPVYAPAAQVSAQERNSVADGLAREMATEPAEQYAASQNATVAATVTNPSDAGRISALLAKSDRNAVAAYAGDLFRGDLRDHLFALTAPTLVVVAVPAQPQGFEGPGAAKTPMAEREAAYRDFYATLFPEAPHVSVVTIPNSKDYVMVDRPGALFDAISAFVAKLSA